MLVLESFWLMDVLLRLTFESICLFVLSGSMSLLMGRMSRRLLYLRSALHFERLASFPFLLSLATSIWSHQQWPTRLPTPTSSSWLWGMLLVVFLKWAPPWNT